MSVARQEFNDWLQAAAQRVNAALQQVLPDPADDSTRLHEAMRYAALGPGKRVRAALVYAAGAASLQNLPATESHQLAFDAAAVAVELIHAYSLVHDDLPCMDDDDLRRGRPTVHRHFNDDALAMLVGDALQPLAFDCLCQMPIAPGLIVQAVQLLARAAGSYGMVGGQAMDCVSTGSVLSVQSLQHMHRMKTGALLEASILLGGVAAGASSSVRSALLEYAGAVGLAFQVVDDVLDVTADSGTLGKTPGKDAAQGKTTYVSLLGLEGSRQLLTTLQRDAKHALLPLGAHGQRLQQLADFIIHREH